RARSTDVFYAADDIQGGTTAARTHIRSGNAVVCRPPAPRGAVRLSRGDCKRRAAPFIFVRASRPRSDTHRAHSRFGHARRGSSDERAARAARAHGAALSRYSNRTRKRAAAAARFTQSVAAAG